MAKPKVIKPIAILMLDSGALIAAGKNQRVEAVIRRWQAEDAERVIAAPCIAESVRGGPKDAGANRIIKTVGRVEPATEAICRAAGILLAAAKSDKTVDAIVVATARDCRATDILTSDPNDIGLFAGVTLNVHPL